MARLTSGQYEEEKQFPAILGQESLEIVTKPGLPAWDSLPPSTRLLAEYPQILPADHVLILGSHHGALSVVLARQLRSGQLWVTDTDIIAIEMTRKTLSSNHIDSVHVISSIDIPEIIDQKINSVFMQLPKGRLLARRWLLQARRALLPGGSLCLAGANKSGIQSAIQDAQDLFGNCRILAYKKGHRLAHLVKSAADLSLPAWASAPGIAPGTWVEFSVSLANHDFRIHSLPGVFSFDHLDEGTQMLINTSQVPAGAMVLDVGCGYGIIGMFAAFQGAGRVDLVDSNLLAIASSRETLEINHITNATVFTGDLLDPVRTNKYDLILSNPPFHTGLAVDLQIAHAMIRQSFFALKPGGQLTIVANRFIQYEHLIHEIFGNVSLLDESRKFHLLSGIKSR